MLEQLFNSTHLDSTAFANADSLPLGKIDITITSSGEWLYEGSKFKRRSMVKLLADKLYTQDGEYYLLAPEQRLKIRVDDLPFTVVNVDRQERNGVAVIVATTNCEEKLTLGVDHPLVLLPMAASKGENGADDELLPALLVRNGLYARFSRPAYYHLVDWAKQVPPSDGDGANELALYSDGQRFVMGQY